MRSAAAPGPRSGARARDAATGKAASDADLIPRGRASCTLELGGHPVKLTHLDKIFWPELGLTKGDLLRYYAEVAPWLLPHLRGRAMVMKRYPNGIAGSFFFMKRAPSPRPAWITTCRIAHRSGNVIDFPLVQDLAALLWVVNLGCIDLNPWYAPCDDLQRPDVLHFDLDPTPQTAFARVREAALVVQRALTALGMQPLAKTTGSRGIHVTVAIARGPTSKQVWGFAKELAQTLARVAPALLTAEYRVAHRPADRVLVDYNQNAWGRTLASIYSVRPRPLATVSTPVTWAELERGVSLEQFDLRSVPRRLRRLGDLWASLLGGDRYDLEALL